MLAKLVGWLKPLPDGQPLSDEAQIKRLYRNWRIKMFFGMYFGYALFYFTRKNLDYVKPAISENFGLDVVQLGYIGTTIYLTYGVGKFLSGVMADRCNIRGVMALGLFVSSLLNLAFPFLPQFQHLLGNMGITLPLVALAWGSKSHSSTRTPIS